jgi:alcohol dehydrogenase class IV
MTATEILRKQVRKYINTADENSLRRVNAILEIDQNSNEWWKDKQFLKELDSMNDAIESGADKGVTFQEIETSIEARRLEIYRA